MLLVRGTFSWAVLATVMLVAALGVAGCSSTNNAKKLLNPDPPGKMYARADAYMNSGRYEAAAHRFEKVDRNHPYSKEARRAIVMAAYAYYKAGKHPEAIATAKRYTVMHPGTKEAPFAHYIIASAYFDGMNGPKNDQSSTRKALAEMKTLQSRYPNSTYARKIENRVRLARDMLAAQEMNVGRYYLKRKNYVGSINRFKTVVKEYQTTRHVEEALMRLTECYMALGIKHEAQAAAAILGHNFPNSKWYKDAYELLQSDGLAPRNSGDSWLSRTWKSVKLPRLSLTGR